MTENELTEKIIGAAIKVHRTLGPGLLESVYEECLCVELMRLGIPFCRQQIIPIIYEGLRIAIELRYDLLVDSRVIVELKSVERLIPVHEAKLLSYLRLTGCTVGLLINFNVPVLVEGVKRMVNNFHDSAPPRLRG